MKIRTLMMAAVVALCTTACSDEEEVATVADIAGTYEGYTVANCAYMQDMYAADETVVLSANTDGSATIRFSSDTWGEFSVSNASMNENGGVYTLAGNGQTQMGMNGNVSSYDCTFTATVRSKDDATMHFVVPAVMGGLTIDFVTGDAPAE